MNKWVNLRNNFYNLSLIRRVQYVNESLKFFYLNGDDDMITDVTSTEFEKIKNLLTYVDLGEDNDNDDNLVLY